MFFGGAEKPDADDYGTQVAGRSSNASKAIKHLTNLCIGNGYDEYKEQAKVIA